jgi:hypothetical protein
MRNRQRFGLGKPGNERAHSKTSHFIGWLLVFEREYAGIKSIRASARSRRITFLISMIDPTGYSINRSEPDLQLLGAPTVGAASTPATAEG